MFGAYDNNRDTGAFILIDPDSHNTVAGGMIVASATAVDDLETGGETDHVVLTLPRAHADQLLSSEAFAALRDHAEIRRTSGARAAALLRDLE